MGGLEELDILFDHIIDELKDPDCPPVISPFDRTENAEPGFLTLFRSVMPEYVTAALDAEKNIAEAEAAAAETAAAETAPAEEAPAETAPAEAEAAPEAAETEAPEAAEEATAQEAPAEPEPEPAPAEPQISIIVAEDKLSAAVLVRSGSFTFEMLRQNVQNCGIKFGVDENVLLTMAEKQTVGEEVIFAKGIPPVNGTDGSLIIVAEEGAPIKKGDEICKIVPAEEGTDGKDIFGEVIHTVKGKAPDVPRGINVGFNADHSALIAAGSGKLLLENGAYSVRDEIVVSGDLKRPNDQLEASGDITINGNVNEGATITAGGAVYIRGSVTGAEIRAKQVTVEFATRHTKIYAKGGSVKLANCDDSEITCEGSVYASKLVNCKVSCSGDINCLSGQGIISGGEVRSIGNVSCQILGNNMNESMSIYLGDCSVFTAERDELKKKIALVDLDIRKLDMHAKALKEKKKANGSIPKEDEDFLNASLRIRLQKTLKKEPLQNRLDQVEQIIGHTESVMLKVTNTLFSNVTITIKDHTATTDIRHGKVTVYESDTGLIYAV